MESSVACMDCLQPEYDSDRLEEQRRSGPQENEAPEHVSCCEERYSGSARDEDDRERDPVEVHEEGIFHAIQSRFAKVALDSDVSH